MVENFKETERLVRLGELRGGVEDWSDLYPLIFNQVGIPKGRILDVGSGDARFSRWLKYRGIKRDTVSFDIRDFGNQPSFVRGTARALPFRDSTFDSVISIGAVSIHTAGTSFEAEIMNEMISVARKRLVVWPAYKRLIEWLDCYPTLNVRTYDLIPNHESSAGLKILTIDK